MDIFKLLATVFPSAGKNKNNLLVYPNRDLKLLSELFLSYLHFQLKNKNKVTFENFYI